MSGESLEDEGEKIAEMLVNAGREGREAEEMGILGVLMVRNASTDMICTRKPYRTSLSEFLFMQPRT